MKSLPLFLPIWLLALHPQLSFAYWRMACSVSQTARADPILNPGGVSGHGHKFAGGSNVNENSDHASLLTSTCSSCEVQKDTSAYWTPQLYFAHANGSFEEVPNYGMTVYYVGRGGNATNTVPFPTDFRMITGDTRLRSYDTSTLTYMNTRPVADRVSFRCINEANNIPETHYIDQTDCVNGLRAQVNFQSCWDGVNNYLDNSAHVAYLSNIDSGECPPTHPVSIPGLFFEVLYMTNSVDQSAGGEFVFSNGDPTGFGFHGDFMNGWDMDVQTDAVENCLYTDNDGVVTACPYLTPSDDVNFPRTCPEQPSLFDEPIHGMIDALPGCNPITPGPALAPQVVCPLNSHSPNGAGTSSASVAASTGLSSSILDSTTSATSTSETASSAIASLSTPATSLTLSTTTPAALTISISPTSSSSQISTSSSYGVSSTLSTSELIPTSTSGPIDASSSDVLPTSATSLAPALSSAPLSTSVSDPLVTSTSDLIPTSSALGDPSATGISGDPFWLTGLRSGWSWRTPGGVFVQVSSTDSSATAASSSSDPGSILSTPSDSLQTTSVTAGAIGVSSTGSEVSSMITPGLTSSLSPQSEVTTTVTITDFVTLTVTVGSSAPATPGNFVAVTSNTLTPSVAVAPGENQATTSVQLGTTVTPLSSALSIPASAVTLSPGSSGDGVSNIVTVITATTIIPGSTIVESGTTISVEQSTATQPVSVLSSAGNFYTITGSTTTTFLSFDASSTVAPSAVTQAGSTFSVAGTFYTITGSTYTTFVSIGGSDTGLAGGQGTQPTSVPTPDGTMYTITESTYTTFFSAEDSSSSTEGTSTTTIISTTTLYTTVLPTSTRTLSAAFSQSTAAGNTTLTTVTSAPAGEFFASGSSSSTFASSSVSAESVPSCSNLSGTSGEGCPPSSITSSVPVSDDGVATAFVTVIEPITDEVTSTVDTTLTLSSATADTTFFTIRGRKVRFTGR
ncbi:hypothetical protein A1O1_00583 [Capronia coronata CBS 617.96]|uniref:DUF1996 domain-containing protein n=1 Tax=Capronia coronata CBS 617.96 TaxID=1182541 RepID=W9Z1L9_9EURO|nr:uncharacterized protein A1O1_00583 [Capronia coronata CBS 617.96]EXJ95461.1 hypothetical protein A1O1_00583 [Capronia coronata CBS 617.96]